MIGVFDSGIGGLTVVKEIVRHLPTYDLVYLGDTARVPYGNKSEELIKKYAEEDANFLLQQGAKIIVVACNTASALALDYLHNQLNVPVFGVIEPAVRAAQQATRNNRVGVIGTRATVNSQIFSQLINNPLKIEESFSLSQELAKPAFLRKNKKLKNSSNKIKLFSQATPLLVPLIEENYLQRPEVGRIIKHYLQPLKNQQIDTLILGCTHYPIIENLLAEKMKGVKIINSAAWLALELEEFINSHLEISRSLSQRKSRQYFVTDFTHHLAEVAKNFMGKKINLETTQLS